MSGGGWALAWRLARRDLHRSVLGLRLLFVCLFLGTATLAAIGSLTASITQELAARGQAILGGDVEVSMTQREASAREKAAFRAAGRVSETIRMRAMARPVEHRSGGDPSHSGDAVLTELKAVDGAYPLYGTLTLDGGAAPTRLADDSVLIAPALAERMGVRTGDRLRFGEGEFRIAGLIGDEPDLASIERKAGIGDPPGVAADDPAEKIARVPSLVGGEVGQAEHDIVDVPRMVRNLDRGDDPAVAEEAHDHSVVALQGKFANGLAVAGRAVGTHLHSRCLRRTGQAERDDCQKGLSDHLCPPPP